MALDSRMREVLREHRPIKGSDLVGYWGVCSCGIKGEPFDLETFDDWLAHLDTLTAEGEPQPPKITGPELVETTDADVWAEQFCARFGGDTDLMRSWFASAIMTGYDKGRGAIANCGDELQSKLDRMESPPQQKMVCTCDIPYREIDYGCPIHGVEPAAPQTPYGEQSILRSIAQETEPPQMQSARRTLAEKATDPIDFDPDATEAKAEVHALRVHPNRKDMITHEQARTSLQRFVNRHFNNAGEKSRASIPAHQDDDDILLNDYITQRAAHDAERDALAAKPSERSGETGKKQNS